MIVYKHGLLAMAVVVSCLTIANNAANIVDLLEWSLLGKDAAQLRAEEDGVAAPGGQRNCLCDGPSCICCVDFNLTFIDLGGPGCVRMKYISQEEGFAVNMSYGANLLHSQIVKGPDPEPICLNIVSRVAQLCARVTELAPTSDGLRGCVQLEPTLLGEPTLDFPIGCFKSGADGMTMEPMRSNGTEEDLSALKPDPDSPTGINTEEILQAVNDSAEEGIAFFSSLLGFNFGKTNKTETSSEAPNTESSEGSQSPQVAAKTSRSSKNIQSISKFNEIN